ncbi:MAG: hypothetical protein KJO08_05865 [Gammaproteobacteria bacterium]|nr:hypothetical protein [Gammaproteobacteria bacterium]NNJ85462.1 sulfurtransferase [Gammaproteobacteria bacterium]
MKNLHTHKAPWLMAFLGLAWLASGTLVSAATLPGPVVDTAWLAENLDNVVLLDVRKDVKSFEKRSRGAGGPVNPCGPGGKKAKAPVRGDGHIEGAVLISFKKILGSYKHANGKKVKVILPQKEAFEKLMQGAGVDNDSTVVITSKGQGLSTAAFAARLYWTLKYFGFDNMAILDGGTVQWKLDKHKVKYGSASKPSKGNFTAATERKEILASMDDVIALTKGEGDAQLLDVRGKDLYLGLTYMRKYVLPEGRGHIPGAKNFPVVLMANYRGPAATLYSKENIEKVAALSDMDLTNTPTVTTCNTGVMASLGWFILSEWLGNKNVRLHDGSMLEWAIDGQSVMRPLEQ